MRGKAKSINSSLFKEMDIYTCLKESCGGMENICYSFFDDEALETVKELFIRFSLNAP